VMMVSYSPTSEEGERKAYDQRHKYGEAEAN
jgi:hypothetical protein